MKTSDDSLHIYFETERLIIRQYKLDDIDDLSKNMSEFKVHQYTKNKNHPWDRQKTEDYIQFFISKILCY